MIILQNIIDKLLFSKLKCKNKDLGYSTFVIIIAKVDNLFLSFKGILISERLSPHTGHVQSAILNSELIISFILLFKVNFSNVIQEVQTLFK